MKLSSAPLILKHGGGGVGGGGSLDIVRGTQLDPPV